VARQRLDRALVDRGLVPSRQAAISAIETGRVLVGGTVADKPARQVAAADPIRLIGEGPRYVSRGGQKLERGLRSFSVAVSEVTAVDAGSATGGFTDCLLQAGAGRVVAVDVGYGQLHERLRSDRRVLSMERTNVRDLDRSAVADLVAPSPPPTLVTADLSFTSLRPLVPVLLDLAGPDGELVVLCKPQFEVGREVAARGRGVVRERSDRREALVGVIGTFEGAGATIMGVVSSPVLGPAGNAEFLLHARRGHPASADLLGQIERALDEVEALA
jgi:23S rRNA (cytidine1920-2'-O)/16S rRNA (cytidine1409-2'-O)-methyltransferase